MMESTLKPLMRPSVCTGAKARSKMGGGMVYLASAIAFSTGFMQISVALWTVKGIHSVLRIFAQQFQRFSDPHYSHDALKINHPWSVVYERSHPSDSQKDLIVYDPPTSPVWHAYREHALGRLPKSTQSGQSRCCRFQRCRCCERCFFVQYLHATAGHQDRVRGLSQGWTPHRTRRDHRYSDFPVSRGRGKSLYRWLSD